MSELDALKQFDLTKEYIDLIRPYIEQHGGAIDLVRIEDGVVYLRLGGACIGCSALDVTIKDGIEQMLIENVEGIIEVRVADE
ncbi:MAG: NifU family protein [Acholeplasmatales bacterium]|jgi:Fe-S cluster biogenesis protein NfuA|nr:NifU family protein [Acholeplasmatales bacterium]